MICKNCGAELEEDSLFCTSCGESVVEESEKVESLDKGLFDQSDDLTVPLTDEEESDDSAKYEGEFAEADDVAEETFDEETGDALTYDAVEPETEGETEVLNGTEESVETDNSENRFTQNKMPIAVMMLAVAALAIMGFLFVDRLFLSKSKDTRATTIRIISQSEDVSVAKNTPTEFFVDAQGTNLTYQWYYRKSGDQMWHIWKNHNQEKTQSVANESWNGMEVYCMITDNNRTAVASEVIKITIE